MYRSMGAKIASQAPSALFIVAIPLLLISVSVTWAVNDLRFYRHGFDKFDIPRVTGIERDDLIVASSQIRSYFNSRLEPLEIRTRIYAEETELFNQREVLHMRDVKRLIWGVYGVGMVSALYLVGFATVGFSIYRRPFAYTLSRHLLWGGGLTVGLVAIVGLLAVAGFDSLFATFHQVSFANDFWKLDSRTDHLVMMFPQGFWFDATLFVGLSSVGQAIALAGVAGGFLAWRRRNTRRRQEPLLQSSSEVTEL